MTTEETAARRRRSGARPGQTRIPRRARPESGDRQESAQPWSDDLVGVEDSSTAPGVEPPADRFDSARLRRRLRHADALAIVVGLMAAFILQEILRPVPSWIQLEHLLLSAVALPAWLAAIGVNKLYLSRVTERAAVELRGLLVSGAVGVGAMLSVAFALKYDELSRFWIVAVFVLVTLSLVIERWAARRAFARLRASGRLNRRVAVIGTDAHAIGLLHTVERNRDLGYEIVGFIGNDDLGQREGKTVLGTFEHTIEILREQNCVGAMISLNSVAADQVNRLTRQLTDEGFHVALSTSLRDIDVTRMRPQTLDGQTMIYVEPIIRTGWREDAKRAFDVAVASLGLLFTAPVIAVSAILIKAESNGPAFFRQNRVGLDGKAFQIIKLRTMYLDAEERKAELMAHNEMDGPLFKMEHDPRITRVGRILRKLSIDELPQFWNVIKNEMSVVGPRPALPDEVAQWDADVHDRLRVLPGITGMWQVSGRSDTTFDEYKRLDLYYVDNWSLVHDASIVAKTFGVVVLQRGAA